MTILNDFLNIVNDILYNIPSGNVANILVYFTLQSGHFGTLKEVWFSNNL